MTTLRLVKNKWKETVTPYRGAYTTVISVYHYSPNEHTYNFDCTSLTVGHKMSSASQ